MNQDLSDTTVVKSNVLETLRSQKDSILIALTIIIEFSFVLAVIAYWSAVLRWQVDLQPAGVILSTLIAFVFFTVSMFFGNRKNEERRASQDKVMGRFDNLDTNQKEVMSRFDKLDAKQDTIQNDLAANQTTLDDIKAILLRIEKYFTSGSD